MGLPNNRKDDLFDTRNGKIDLFAGRKRKAGAMDSPPRDGYDREGYQRDHQHRNKDRYPAQLDLGSMLHGHGIPKKSYDHIQGVLKSQYQQLQDLKRELAIADEDSVKRRRMLEGRDAEIVPLQRKIDVLEKANERVRAENRYWKTENESSLKHLREKRAALQDQVKEKDELIALGTRVVNEQTEKTKRLEEDNARLRATVTERDASISKLTEQLWKVTTAPADQAAKVLLDAQAAQMCFTINGLNKDVAVSNKKVKSLEAQVEKMNAVIGGLNGEKVGLQRAVHDVERELGKQRGVAEAAAERARSAREVAEGQEKLVQRLMRENERLSGMQHLVRKYEF